MIKKSIYVIHIMWIMEICLT